MQNQEVAKQLSKLTKEIINAACKDYLLDGKTSVKQLIAQLLIITGAPMPTDLEQTYLEGFIQKNYRAFTPEEIKLAFELNIRGEYLEKINHFQSFNADYFGSVMKEYQESKRKAWAEFNKYKPSEPKQLDPIPNQPLQSLIDFYKTNNDFPVAWNWSAAFDEMIKLKMTEPYNEMQAWMQPVKKKLIQDVSMKLATCSNLIEKRQLEIEKGDMVINLQLRKLYVQKRIKELYL